MFGLDDHILRLGESDVGIAAALAVALLLGLRHATDPDHLTAVSTLAVADREHGARRAGRLGAAWGLGHAAVLVIVGLPVVLFSTSIPPAVERGAGLLIGILIAALAIRLLIRWRRGYFHMHPHDHAGVRHSHIHMHEHWHAHAHPVEHEHRHADAAGTGAMAFGIGMAHGLGGSGALAVLVVSSMPGRATAAVALAVFAAASAVSMALVSAAFGGLLTRDAVARRLERSVPVLGMVSLLFGAWYAVGAI